MITFYAYYVAGLIWGMYTSRFMAPTFLLLTVWHLLFWGNLPVTKPYRDELDFRLWLPLATLAGITIGRGAFRMLGRTPVLIWRYWDAHVGWFIASGLQLVGWHFTLALWEMHGVLVPPLNYWLAWSSQILMLVLWYFATRNMSFWYDWDPTLKTASIRGDPARQFYSVFGVLLVSASSVFMTFEWIFPDVHLLWITLGVFGLHLLLVSAIYAFFFSSGGGGNNETAGSESGGVTSEATAKRLYKTSRLQLASHLQRMAGSTGLFGSAEKDLEERIARRDRHPSSAGGGGGKKTPNARELQPLAHENDV